MRRASKKQVKKMYVEEHSDLAEGFRAMDAHRKEKSSMRRQCNVEALMLACVVLGVQNPFKIADHQYRVRHADIVIDVYPVNMKFHNITINQRGTIRPDMKAFIKREFNL